MKDIKVLIDGDLSLIDRQGVTNLISFLDSSDFYTAPCSTKFHLACPGGLAQHTWNVFECARVINSKYNVSEGGLFSEENLLLASVGHDLCKVGFYKETHEDPTDPQLRYLTSLFSKAGLAVPKKLNKTYAGTLIDFMLNQYKKSPECVKIPEYQPNYVVDDTMPLGHGEKSLYIMQQFIELTLDEALSIRWHMGAFELNQSSVYQRHAYDAAVKQSKLVSILILADFEASNLLEV